MATEFTPAEQKDMTERMTLAFLTARRMQRDPVGSPYRTISLQVGQRAWDWMQHLAHIQDPPLPPNRPATAWGFPVTLSESDDDRIVVRADLVIL